ncbi:ENT domain-containing protein [Chloropicon primus]|uniref:ENT domain-containing protein n=2 Tax=Chloropicon primus TaxID=1764295 RepID=A0A5B8MNK4_9CHLO|nr:hypothetical protein A3770_06p45770 [Chloropicon primus]UPR01279.1 ENT domain-containing protein [Chloropicon primus]|eukprot:QDZ22059.1 hypothetical protein A3770_06p45770 [Chloropicon primus]
MTDVKSLERDAYIATLRALHFQKQSTASETALEKEKLKLLLKKCLRISDEVHLECLEKAMSAPSKPRKSEGGKKEKSGGYGSSDRPPSKKRKHAEKGLRKTGGPIVVDEYIGRKVERFWPEDGGWVSGAISDFNAVSGEHCIVYDLGTKEESWEWYNIRNASESQCRLVEGERVDLLTVAKAPGAVHAGDVSGESLENLEKMKAKLKAKKELLETQLTQLEDSDSDNITYSEESD